MDKLHRLMETAKHIADTHSKDRSTKLACLIADEDLSPLSWGYNGFPRGVNDNLDERHQRPAKYLWAEHAERNAIYNAARSGIKLKGGIMILPRLVPCVDCARAIIQSGIKKLYIENEALTGDNPRAVVWRENWDIVKSMFDESGVEVIVLTPNVPTMAPSV